MFIWKSVCEHLKHFWKQKIFLPTSEQIRGFCYLHSMEYYSVMKRDDLSYMQQHEWISRETCSVKEARFKRPCLHIVWSTYMIFCTSPRGRRAPNLPCMRRVLSKILDLAPQPSSPTVMEVQFLCHAMLLSPILHHTRASLPPRVCLLQSHLLSTKIQTTIPECAPALPGFSSMKPDLCQWH